MNKGERIAALQKRFEMLKHIPENDWFKQLSIMESLAQKIVIPMLKLDLKLGMEMWEYLLVYHLDKLPPIGYHSFTDDLVENCDAEILSRVFQKNKNIVKHVFTLDPYEHHLHCAIFIRQLLCWKQVRFADELMVALYNNTSGENEPQENLHAALIQIINSPESRWGFNAQAVQFATKWVEKIESPALKASLEVDLLDLQDCVQGSSPKGGMPLGMFLERGGSIDSFDDQGGSWVSTDDEDESFEDESPSIGHTQTDLDSGKVSLAMEELTGMIGLADVKEEVNSLVNLMKVRQLRREQGLKIPDMSLHLVFSGNPGTGKTTVARILGKIYRALGVLSSGHLIEVDRSGLVAGYVGQTAIKTQKVIESALGGILFIDEAYSLVPEDSGNDFGAESVDTILKAMEDNRDDLVVIVAGYDELMPRFINSNPGLKSRFNKYIYFQDYTGSELLDILLSFTKKNDYILDKDVEETLRSYLEKLYRNRDMNFGNARDVRNLFEKMVERQANRIVTISRPTMEEMLTITMADIEGLVE